MKALKHSQSDAKRLVNVSHLKNPEAMTSDINSQQTKPFANPRQVEISEDLSMPLSKDKTADTNSIEAKRKNWKGEKGKYNNMHFKEVKRHD